MPVPETHEGDHPEPSKRNYLLKTDGSGTGTIDNPAQGAIGVVVDQVNGCAKVGKEHIRPLHAEACSLLQEFPNIRISWIPRKWNAEADALATKALPGR